MTIPPKPTIREKIREILLKKFDAEKWLLQIEEILPELEALLSPQTGEREKPQERKPSGQEYWMECTKCKTIYDTGEIHYCGKVQPPQPKQEWEGKTVGFNIKDGKIYFHMSDGTYEPIKYMEKECSQAIQKAVEEEKKRIGGELWKWFNAERKMGEYEEYIEQAIERITGVKSPPNTHDK